ncbi:MAG: ScyD/ScyE family protein [Thermomicrobiales bacterium]|nr:ScyD/ScyE family protein [Thermomicrobiales bacterium]
MRRGKQAIGAFALIAMLIATLIQPPAPATAQSDAVAVIARGLTTPGGFAWNANDVLFVALGGSGGADPVLPEAPQPLGPITSGPTGAVIANDDGCPVALATGIVSNRTPQGRISGAQAVTELDGQLYLLFSNGGDRYGSHELTDGVYRLGGDGSLNLVADHTAFLQANPPAVAPPEGLPNPGNPVAMIAADGSLWIADQLNGLISRVTPGRDEELVADLSELGLTPSDLAIGSNGSLYASSFGRAPYESGSAGIVQISSRGEASIIWTGLTMASGVTVGNDGVLYATEMASGVSDDAPNGYANSGRLVRQAGPDSAEIVADGLMFPTSLGTGPDGAVYFSAGAVGTGNGDGWIGRYAPDGSVAEAAPAECEPIAETLSDVPDIIPTAPATVTAAPDETAVPNATEEPTPQPTVTPEVEEPWTPDSAAPTGEVVDVGLNDYWIDMPSTLPAGPVTFVITNYGTVAHSLEIDGANIDIALTHALEPGQTGAFTLELSPGTYAVSCPEPGHRDSGMSLVLTVH